MTMRRILTGIDPQTSLPQYALVHPFLAGLQKRRIGYPDTHTTKKTKRVVPAFRAMPDGADKPVRQEKYNRANR